MNTICCYSMKLTETVTVTPYLFETFPMYSMQDSLESDLEKHSVEGGASFQTF